MDKQIKAEQVDQLKVRVFEDRAAMGAAAGTDAADRLRELLGTRDKVRIVFAAAPSQNETLATLAKAPGIDWSRVVALHMDEYLGLRDNAPQRFGKYLKDHLFDLVKPGRVLLIGGNNEIDIECQRYEEFLDEGPIDMVLLGIGENGHIAFNDPPVADFNDLKRIKPVELDEACRRQQVNDGCFPAIANVPTHALTLTIPTLMSGGHLFCSVPGPTKREAVRRTLTEQVSTECPSTILRTHPNCTLYVDRAAYGE
ncbi:MAG TPA: glucosamine-6-phosphate deaminase [Tepidisphaeraceae bacterium]|nr:glucosamine-6-phosphate deaminase [Tepidisphaeraceae bacterium]